MCAPQVIPAKVINFSEINTGKLKAVFCNQVESVCVSLDSSGRIRKQNMKTEIS